MNELPRAGDLLKAVPPAHLKSDFVVARPSDSNFWSLRVPRDFPLLVAATPGMLEASVLVLFEEQFVSVLLADVEYMSKSRQ